MKAFWHTLHKALTQDEKVFVAIVVANQKGSPGTVTARMIIHENGDQFGTIGGGIMEKDVVELSREALRASQFPNSIKTLHHKKNYSNKASGLICGGSQTNLYMVLEPKIHTEIAERICHTLDIGLPAIVQILPNSLDCINLDSPPSYSLFYEENETGWKININLTNLRRVAIFGGGHCGVALANLMINLGYDVTLFETRQDVFTLRNLASGCHVHLGQFDKNIGHLIYPRHTHAVVLTHSYPTDIEALHACLPLDFISIGVMGSRPKLHQIFLELANRGHVQERINNIDAPVGLPFNSDTPEEIAVSIAAQILLKREYQKLS